ncbi:MAG: hypothetical protein ACLQPD_10210 [Desulfomonilaceae bacterium]
MNVRQPEREDNRVAHVGSAAKARDENRALVKETNNLSQSEACSGEMEEL